MCKTAKTCWRNCIIEKNFQPKACKRIADCCIRASCTCHVDVLTFLATWSIVPAFQLLVLFRGRKVMLLVQTFMQRAIPHLFDQTMHFGLKFLPLGVRNFVNIIFANAKTYQYKISSVYFIFSNHLKLTRGTFWSVFWSGLTNSYCVHSTVHKVKCFSKS